MPEGHLVHRFAVQLTELVGAPVAATSPQGRFTDGARAVDGKGCETVEAWGKHLLIGFGAAGTVHVHLGMQGVLLRLAPPGEPKRQVRLRLRLAVPDLAWDLIAPATCELLDEMGVKALQGALGPDPLRPDADAAAVREAFRSDDRAIGTVLLDQSVLAGVGNVFRAELLSALRLHPSRPASSVDDATFTQLWTTLQRLMTDAMDKGRIVTRPPDGRMVYKQERCGRCGAEVATFPLSGRTAYACPVCQPA